MIPIIDENSPLIDDFRSLKNKTFKDKNLILMETKKVIDKYFLTNLKPLKCLITQDYYDEQKNILESKINPENIYVADKNIMQNIVGYKLHHGIMLIGEKPRYIDLNVIEYPCLILNGVTSPENVGTIIRTCAAFSVKSIIVDEKTCSPYLRRAIRVSMGNIFQIGVHATDNLKNTILKLISNEVSIIGSANLEKAICLPNYKFPKRAALIMGSEGEGIDEHLLNLCDTVVKIPMSSDVNSLNVHNATSIFLYEMTKGNF